MRLLGRFNRSIHAWLDAPGLAGGTPAGSQLGQVVVLKRAEVVV
jgi:hypothetical protein